MLSMKSIFENLTEHHVVETFVQWMAKENEDFAADYQRYAEAMGVLQKELGDLVKGEIDAIEQQCASNLLFSGFLGLKANLDNFIDPVARNFLDADFEVYLREETAHRLPKYACAQRVRDRFYSLLTPAQRKIYEDVMTYNSHLETVGPKLAHYFGYILGNQLLPRVVPGYHSDMVLTIKYNSILEDYFGKHFSSVVLQIPTISFTGGQ